MHSGSRRLPVENRERARHAKRLVDIQPVNDSNVSPVVLNDSAATTTSTTPTPSASAAKSTAATAPTTTPSTPTTTPSATISSSQAKISSVVSSSTSLSSSTSQTLTSSASLSASLSTPPSTTSSTSNPNLSISFSNTSTSQSIALTTTPTSASINASATSSNQLSGSAIGGIIAASVIVALALLIFIIRKTYLRRRQTRRISVSWPDGGVFNDAKPLPAAPVEDYSSSEKPSSVRNAPALPFDTSTRPIYARPPQPPVQNMRSQSPFRGYATPAPPDPSYNNPMPAYSGYPTVNPMNSNAIVSMARAAAGTVNSYPTPAPRLQASEEAFINRVFIPSLPDELSVTVGERTRVLALYDDGWALCANGRGEQGMVPQECLDQRVVSDEGDNRNARRSSSLLNFDGRRY